ncbi:MAG TPA: hypothetical protein VII78_16655 [Myxococcota bacterium]|jgi:hypothetical protein
MYRSRFFASLALIAGLLCASAAGAREYRSFDLGDRVYYQRSDRELEPIVEPHIYLARAERAFARGSRSYAAENLEKAAAGFGYFSARAAGTDRRQLEFAGRALDELARSVRRGEVDGVAVMADALSVARRVLDGEAVMPAPAAEPS